MAVEYGRLKNISHLFCDYQLRGFSMSFNQRRVVFKNLRVIGSGGNGISISKYPHSNVAMSGLSISGDAIIHMEDIFTDENYGDGVSITGNSNVSIKNLHSNSNGSGFSRDFAESKKLISDLKNNGASYKEIGNILEAIKSFEQAPKQDKASFYERVISLAANHASIVSAFL
ncbi:hypothetical protein M0208_07455 [Sphingomonas sp. SUN019]|uniref:hypothetical protein n=1 Tax=Sphingomonas sp. SUN019 TaxID=2937788 RepID=UPI00216438EC|nr:hypothetical protein [Sphingomonas sp. SUN019]UVO50364.1 hypothetical protein M0208_07455 [Sphingomonas sp. SUN019]